MEKLYSLFLTVLATLTALNASAITVDDLDGKVVGHMHQGNNPQWGSPQWSNGARFEKNSSGGLDIVGFYSEYRIPVTLENNCLTIKRGDYNSLLTPGRTLTIGLSNTVGSDNATIDGSFATGYSSPSTRGTLTSNACDTITDPNGFTCSRFRFDYRNSKQAISLVTKDKTVNILPEFCSNIDIFVIEPNATATHYYQGTNYGTWKVRLTEKNNGELEIQNYLNRGVFYNNVIDYEKSQVTSSSRNWATGTVDNAGNCTLNTTNISSFLYVAYYGYTSIYPLGRAYWFSRATFDNYYLYLTSSATGGRENITGKKTTKPEPVHKNNTKTRWTKADDGELITVLPTTYKFNDSYVYYEGTEENVQYYDSVVIEMNEGSDYTHGITLGLNRSDFGFNPSNGHFYGRFVITSAQNSDYVESYDLYMVPGQYSSIKSSSFVPDNDKGHADAICIKEGITHGSVANGLRAASANDETEVWVKCDANDKSNPLYDKLVGLTDGSNNYTFFLKANYTESSGLHPTFHSLTTLETATGLENLEAEETVAKVSVVGGAIVIEGSDEVAEVYTTSGALVYTGLDREINLNGGVYIVRVGKVVTKVML